MCKGISPNFKWIAGTGHEILHFKNCVFPYVFYGRVKVALMGQSHRKCMKKLQILECHMIYTCYPFKICRG